MARNFGGVLRKIVIIGGGVAGLSALNRLADLGVQATLIEGGEYPAHKICGEFFSPESASILSQWNVDSPVEIDQISFRTAESSLNFPLPFPAQSQARFDFDFRLVKRAREKGAVVFTHTKVTKIEKKEIYLDNGNVIDYTDLIMSAGRFYKSREPEYVGIKGHLKGLELNGHLEMFPFEGGYGGLSPIGEGSANFACLIHKNKHRMATPLQSVFQLAPQLEKRLEKGSLIYQDWMVCPVPPFGIKKTGSVSHTYFIGDAAGTIPPASGLGLSLALSSGYMVADYAIRGDYLGFQKAWNKKYQSVFRYGQCLHHLMMRPLLFRPGMKLGQLFPAIGPQLFKMTRIKKVVT